MKNASLRQRQNRTEAAAKVTNVPVKKRLAIAARSPVRITLTAASTHSSAAAAQTAYMPVLRNPAAPKQYMTRTAPIQVTGRTSPYRF